VEENLLKATLFARSNRATGTTPTEWGRTERLR